MIHSQQSVPPWAIPLIDGEMFSKQMLQKITKTLTFWVVGAGCGSTCHDGDQVGHLNQWKALHLPFYHADHCVCLKFDWSVAGLASWMDEILELLKVMVEVQFHIFSSLVGTVFEMVEEVFM